MFVSVAVPKGYRIVIRYLTDGTTEIIIEPLKLYW